MEPNIDFIDVYFVGNPLEKFSSYPHDLEKDFFIKGQLAEPLKKYVEVPNKDKWLYYYVENDKKSKTKSGSIKNGRYFGIVLQLNKLKIKRKERENLFSFLIDFLKKEATFNTNIFARSNQNLYEIKEFNEVQQDLDSLIKKLKVDILKKFVGSIKTATKNTSKNSLDDFNRIDTENLNSKEVSLFDSQNLKNIIIVTIIALFIPFLIDPVCSRFGKANLVLSIFKWFFVFFFLLLFLTGFLIFLKKKNYQDNRISCIIFFIGIFIAVVGFNKEILNNSRSVADSLVYSLTEKETKLYNKKGITNTLLCIDKSGSSNEEVADSKLIENWDYEINQIKKFLNNHHISESTYRNLIDNKVTEFDLMKIKALKIVRESKENITLFIFGDSTRIKKNSKKEKIKTIINLKNNDKFTDFENLFTKLKNEIKDSNNYNIIMLSDFVKHTKSSDFLVDDNLKKSFQNLTVNGKNIIFNFLFFNTQTQKDDKNCMFCFYRRKPKL